jgi:thymidylate synthase
MVLYNAENQYLSIMRDIMDTGEEVMDRTETGTKKLFGKTIIHDFSLGFPLLTTKKMHIKSIVGELIWFLKGTEDAQFLIDNNITIWDEWMKEEERVIISYTPELYSQIVKTGRKILPHTYGIKWRNFGGKDQIAEVIDSIRKNPHSRRHVVSAWDPPNVEKAALPWCHVMFQFNCGQNDALDISVYQRSADWFLGVPFNLASYAFLLHMIAQQTGRKPRRMTYNFGDAHIYINHQEACETQLQRFVLPAPTLNLKHRDNISDYEISDFSMLEYNPHSAIKAPVAV